MCTDHQTQAFKEFLQNLFSSTLSQTQHQQDPTLNLEGKKSELSHGFPGKHLFLQLSSLPEGPFYSGAPAG